MKKHFLLRISTVFFVILFAAGLSYAADMKAKAVDQLKTAAKTELIDINSATDQQLKSLPGVSDVYSKKIIDNRPYKKKDQLVSKNVIPKGTYKGIDYDVVTTGSLATLCVQAELPDELVYKMIKTLFDKKADVVKVHEKGKSIDIKTAVNGFSIPLHPGVIKYYKEKGVLK